MDDRRSLVAEADMVQGEMLDAAVVGATGIVGQQFIAALHEHPWFRISCLAASEKSAAKTYQDALRDPNTNALRWFCSEEAPDSVLGMTMRDASTLDLSEGVNVRMIAQGSSELNISFVVREDDVLKSVHALHEEFQLDRKYTH